MIKEEDWYEQSVRDREQREQDFWDSVKPESETVEEEG